MSRRKKVKVKPNFRYTIVHCAICNKKVKILQDFNQEGKIPYELWIVEYQKNRKTYEWGEYVIKAGTSAVLQNGYLCSTCMKKPLEKKIKNV